MTVTFELKADKVEQPWKTITSIDHKQLKYWGKQRESLQHYYVRSCMKDRIGNDFLKQYYQQNEKTINTMIKHCEKTASSIFKSVLFIFTTLEGIVLSILGPEELVQPLDETHNLGKGSIFTVQNAGLNAISLSIEMQEWVYLSGAEHDFKLFKDWNCFCSPVRQRGEIIGYLDMSFSLNDDHLLMAALFASTLKSIEEELGKYDQQELICERFHNHRLSPREKEIGYMWLNNYSALRIASELGITEGTVRNVIKKIYRKTEVCDKGQFLRKFLVKVTSS